jgi:DNA polymerase-3 subunit epsilon
MRQVVLDTETTGLSPQHGHRLTDIGCVEIINRRITGKTFQTHLNPERELDERAAQITGLSYAMLKDKPKFMQIVMQLIDFIGDSDLIIHNASFDLGFLEHEFNLIKHPWVKNMQALTVIDTLSMAREIHPGQKNSLDALCKRYDIDNSHRNYHGALLDAEILAKVYLAMTAGQTSLDLTAPIIKQETNGIADMLGNATLQAHNLKVIYATKEEQAEHAAILEKIKKQK